jgi:hypothetical protein
VVRAQSNHGATLLCSLLNSILTSLPAKALATAGPVVNWFKGYICIVPHFYLQAIPQMKIASEHSSFRWFAGYVRVEGSQPLEIHL